MSAQRKQRNTHPPTLTVFAGPNGSGKTTLTNRLLTENRLGILVNADQIAERLAQVGGKLTATTEMQIQAAKAAEEMRWELLNQGASFTTETVMSDHSRWIRFFEAAHERGYLMSLIFVTTSDPAINIGRVSQRVRMGGHSVDTEKIISRYHKAHQFLPRALELFDQAWFFDNSAINEPVLVLSMTKENGLVAHVPSEQLPQWAKALI